MCEEFKKLRLCQVDKLLYIQIKDFISRLKLGLFGLGGIAIEGADFLTDIATVEAWACLLLRFYYFNNFRREISFMFDGQIA